MSDLADRSRALIEAERRVPLSLRVEAVGAIDGTPPVLRLEFTSRGDRVPLSLWRPEGAGDAPLVWLQYGAGGAVDATHRKAVGALVAAGLAVATVDWPLHGRRASPKLGDRLLAALRAPGPDPNGAAFARAFALQALLDLSRAQDAVAALDPAGDPEERPAPAASAAPGAGAALARRGVDAGRTGWLASGLGAGLCALLATIDPRPAALVLAPVSRASPALPLPLGTHLAAVAPRPVLILAGESPPALSPAEAEVLAEASPQSIKIEAVPGGVDPLGAEAAEAAAAHLAKALR